MKNLKITAFLFTLLLSTAAKSAVITDLVSVDNFFNSYGETVSWTHDINDDGFNLGSDVVNSAYLDFNFNGEDAPTEFCGFICVFFGSSPTFIADGYEGALIVIDVFDLEDGGSFEIDTGMLSLGVGLTGVLSLNSSGMLDVSVTRTFGDFSLADVTLYADVTVSEPSILFTFFIGLMSLLAIRRKIRK